VPTKTEPVPSPLDALIAGLKSAVVLEDPEQIGRLLVERDGERAAARKNMNAGWVAKGDADANARVYKATAKSDASGLLGDGAPSPESATYPDLAKRRGLKWEAGYEGRVVPYWCSDERVDSQGDIVRQSWIFDLFELNPVWPIAHDWGGLPVANGIDWNVLQRRGADYVGPALWMLGLFATKDQYEFADKVFRLVKAGFLRAGSVGLVSDRVIDIRDEAERATLGLGRWGVILEQNHLLEFSPCTLGANPGAHSLLSSAKARGELQPIDLEVARELERSARRRSRDDAGWKAEDRELVAMARLLFPKSKFRAHREVEAPFEEFDQGSLRGYVPPAEEKVADDDRLARVEAKLDAIAAKLDPITDGMVGLAAMLDDVRTLVEAGPIDATLADAGVLDAINERAVTERDVPKSFLQILRERDIKAEVIGSG